MSELNTQYPELPIGEGLDTLSAPERVAPGRHVVHEDLSYREPGALNVRRAYSLLPKASLNGDDAPADLTAGFHRLYTDRGALLAVGADNSIAYELSEQEDRWIAADTAAAFPVTLRHDVLKDIKAQFLDVARVSGWLMVFVANQPHASGSGEWHDHTELCCLLIGEDDKVVRHKQDALSGEAPVSGVKLATVFNQYFMAVWVSGTSLRAAVYDSANPRNAWSAPVTVATTHATARDVDVCSDGVHVYVAYASATALAAAKITVVGSAPSVAAGPSNIAGSSVPNRRVSIACDFAHATLLIVYGNSVAGIVWQTINKSLVAVGTGVLDAAITNPLAITCMTYQVTGGTNLGAAAWTGDAPVGESVMVTFAEQFLLSTGATLAGDSIAGMPWLKPFRYEGIDYFSVLREQRPSSGGPLEQATVYTAAFFAGGARDALVCRMLPFTADHIYEIDGASPISRGGLASVVQVPGSRRFWTVLFEPGVPSVDQVALPQSGSIALFEIDFGADIAGRAVEFDGHLHVAGSVPRRYERETLSANAGPGAGLVRESRGLVGLGLFHSPVISVLTPSNGTGALTVSQTYLYRFTYEYAAADGRRIQSLPTPAIAVTLGASDDTVTIDLGATVQGPSARMAPGRQILIWRTTGNAAVPIFYLAGRIESNVISQPDLLADVALETRPTLYTTSGEVENEGPPPCLALAPWKGRLVALHSETHELWVSKSCIPGEYPGWSGELAYDTNVHRTRPIFISAMGQALIVWWADAIGVVEGEPPSDTNVGSTIRPPVIFARGVGLAERASIVETPIGVFFRSTRGIQLLGLDLSVQFIGEPVAGIVQSESWSIDNAITAAVYLHARGEVRFMLAHGQTIGEAEDAELVGPSYLVFHLERQQWHTHCLGDVGGGEATSPSIADAVEHGGQMVVAWETEFKTNSQFAWIEDSGASADPASTGRPRAQQQTGWIALAGVMGAPRVRKLWLLGTFAPDAQLRVDFDYVDSDSWTPSDTNHVVEGFGAGTPRQQLDVQIGQQYSRAFRLTLRGQVRLLDTIRVEVEVEKGVNLRKVTRA